MPTTISSAYSSAALRHVRDARTLLSDDRVSTSIDQAWHLAGFGPECARKAVLAAGTLAKVLGHSAHDGALMAWFASIEPGWIGSARSPAPTGEWKPDHRYEATGTRLLPDVTAPVEACESDTLRIIAGLWVAGGDLGGLG